MKSAAFLTILSFLLIVGSVQAQKADESNRKRKVTLIVFKDDSGSMNNHLAQVRKVSDQLIKALQRTDCMELDLAVVAQSRFELGMSDNLVYGPLALFGQESKRMVDTGPDRFIRLQRAGDLERFQARIVHGLQTGSNESVVGHVTDTILKEVESLRQSDAVAALVVTDVAVGMDQVRSEDLHLSRIRSALGRTQFVAFALGMDSTADKVSCFPDFPQSCFDDMVARVSGIKPDQNADMAPQYNGLGIEEAFNTLQASGMRYSEIARSCSDRYNLASPDLLQKFSTKSGGRFTDICAPKASEIADQMAEAVLKAAQCQFLM